MAIIVFGYRSENNRVFVMSLTTTNTLHVFSRAVIALITLSVNKTKMHNRYKTN
ncbi:Uncharacterised protein [Yersinia bercovieri]|nr:Uncharacterised protein [Yersinia bercovieri]